MSGPVQPFRLGSPQGPVRGDLASWRRVGRGLYVPDATEPSLEQRIMNVAASLGPHGAITGWAALNWRGCHWLDGPGAVPVRSPDRQLLRTLDRTVIRGGLRADDAGIHRHVRVARPAQALLDHARAVSGRELVVAIDMAVESGLLRLRTLEQWAASRRTTPAVRALRAALPWASALSRSPQETRLRMVWVHDARLPPPRVNARIFGLDGRDLAVIDLLDEESGMVAEYDGSLHALRRVADVRREDALRASGLEVVTVMAPDLRAPEELARRLVRTRARLLAEPRPRRWSLDPFTSAT